jgi:hypothetical protein
MPEYDVEMVAPSKLTPHPDNYREHPPEQIKQIRTSIREFGIYKNVVCADDYTLLAGHGVVRGADEEGYDEIPVYRLDVNPQSALAYKLIAADNELPRLSEDNDEQLANLLKSVRNSPDTSLDGTGFDDYDFDALLDDTREPPSEDEGEREETESRYTDKIDTPTYEPSDEAPSIEDLFDNSTTEELLAKIQAADLPGEVEVFLTLAAHRHTEFDFEKIADYYAHAPPEVQRLMEDSALVVVDFGKAVEDGFVQLTETVRETLIDHPEFNDE